MQTLIVAHCTGTQNWRCSAVPSAWSTASIATARSPPLGPAQPLPEQDILLYGSSAKFALWTHSPGRELQLRKVRKSGYSYLNRPLRCSRCAAGFDVDSRGYCAATASDVELADLEDPRAALAGMAVLSGVRLRSGLTSVQGA